MSATFNLESGFKFTALILFALLSGCAGSAAQEKTQKYASEPAPDKNPIVVAGDCFENAASLKALKENCSIDSSAFSNLLLEGKKLSIAQMVKASGKKVAIFQLAGATCESCKVESKELDKRIAASSVGSQIGHIIMFTDRQSDYLDEDFSNFMRTNSPKGIRAHDENGILWRALQPQKDLREPGRSPVFAADVNGNGAFINLEGRVLDIFAAAERLAKSASVTSSK